MPNELDLTHIKDAADKLQNDDSYNTYEKLNLAAWLGERTHFLVAEIEKLRQERVDLLAALEQLYWLVMEHANDDAFDNGVYAPDGRCEGDVIAAKIIEQTRAAIAQVKGETTYG